MGEDGRRRFLQSSVFVGASLLLAGCNSKPDSPMQAGGEQPKEKKDGSKEAAGEVTATEDLMREHGVLRRALLVYTEAALKLRSNPSAIDPGALQKTAKLFRAFGEDYHEKKLEEAYIFPAVKNSKENAGAYANIVDTLTAQHQRGREITDYIVEVASCQKLTNDSEPLARTLDSFVLMYRNHAAREDTIIFPAWKKTLSARQLDEMNDKFEDIEHEQFGEDGYELAVKQIGDIETSLSLADLAQFTAPPPPPVKA